MAWIIVEVQPCADGYIDFLTLSWGLSSGVIFYRYMMEEEGKAREEVVASEGMSCKWL